MSVPPPSKKPDAPEPPPEFVVALEGSERRESGDGNALRLSGSGISIWHGRLMRAPLELPLGAIKVASVDGGPARVSGQVGRFPILRRVSATAVIPRHLGIDGWLWTSTGGTALTSLGDAKEAPNVALVFAKPLEETRVRSAFDPEFLQALAARSPLGSPTVYGLLCRVNDTVSAGNTFRRFGFQEVLTDKEVPPTLRRHLPTDQAADPVVHGDGDSARSATSVPPPGMS
jgi:hypothetical protein